ncbi:hypothetical protein K1719_036986 [Acacia pycnantha]|nr:hypothetical protein K1719_036986 [Acacia pycnantha]
MIVRHQSQVVPKIEEEERRHDGYDNGMKNIKIWPSDEDAGRWGVADPAIDTKAAAFIAHKKLVFETA